MKALKASPRAGARSDEASPPGERGGRGVVTAIYRRLLLFFGPQGWWPAETPFEVAVGAILTQNTSWSSVEKTIAVLRDEDLLCAPRLAAVPRRRLAPLLRSSGYYNLKARRLRNFLDFLAARHGLRMEGLAETPLEEAREELLAVNGIGPETADSILLYAAGHPVFVVDAYTRRVFSRHGLVKPGVSYHALQAFITARIPRKVEVYKEFHALLVALGKEFCRPRRARCGECPLDPPGGEGP